MEEGSVSLQTWLSSTEYYEEVVRRNNVPGQKWALISLDENNEDDGQGAIPIALV